MSVLIIGASGLVGSYLYKSISLHTSVIGTYQKFAIPGLQPLDISSDHNISKLIETVNPEFVFLPAAFTHVDACEEKKDFCKAINVDGVHNVIKALRGTNTALIYFSTDFIFDGKDGPYTEESKPNPISYYGETKLNAEQLIIENLRNYLIIRTTCVYGAEPQEKNFVMALIKKLRLKEAIEAPFDQITTPTYAGNLAEITWRLVQERKTGIFNVVGANRMSRLDFANLAADTFGLDKRFIRGVTTDSLNRKARRPLNAGLTIDKIEKTLGIRIPTPNESLEIMKDELKNVFV
ncbi:MAG TPA: SDR family oxidoreductase [Candidatus Omnitrophota bacterium]|nr:SDR family oxidoreductase [Candidatus Omnitrophota bacterium]HPT07787.1 SDR family oxidoreductase [Candidatus Omnitrophota bacterium]